MAGFFDSLLGKGGPSPNATYAEQTGALKKAKGKAIGSYQAGLGNALSRVDPYMQSGGRAQDLYAGLIGARGAEGYQDAFSTWQADPFRAESDAAGQRELDRVFRSYNNRGFGDSGLSRLGVGRAALERYDTRLADWRNRLAGLGGQGLGLAQYGAGLEYDTGTRIGDTEFGYGQQKAGLMGYRDNALREQASAGVNNLLKLGGLGVQAAGVAMGMPPVPMGGSASGNANFNGGGYKNIPRRYSFNPTGR